MNAIVLPHVFCGSDNLEIGMDMKSVDRLTPKRDNVVNVMGNPCFAGNAPTFDVNGFNGFCVSPGWRLAEFAGSAHGGLEIFVSPAARSSSPRNAAGVMAGSAFWRLLVGRHLGGDFRSVLSVIRGATFGSLAFILDVVEGIVSGLLGFAGVKVYAPARLAPMVKPILLGSVFSKSIWRLFRITPWAPLHRGILP